MADGSLVEVAVDLANCFHLHPPQAFARIDDEVIALVISVGCRDAKAEGRRLVGECEFSQFTPGFAVQGSADQGCDLLPFA